MTKKNIQYRQDYEDDWIFYAIENRNDNRIYIYRKVSIDRLKKRRERNLDNSKINKWVIAGDKNCDYDSWDYFHPIFFKESKSFEILENFLKEYNIPPLRIDEKGNVI